MEILESLGLTTLVFSVLFVLAKSIEKLVEYISKRRNGNGADYEKELRRDSYNKIDKILGTVQDLQRLHNITDQDGVPLWYMPRSIIGIMKDIVSTQKEIINRLSDIAVSQQKITDLVDRMLRDGA